MERTSLYRELTNAQRKKWLLKHFGVEKYGRLLERDVNLAEYPGRCKLDVCHARTDWNGAFPNRFAEESCK